MRTPLVAGNWKMNTTLSDAVALVREMKLPLNGIGGAERVVCPPFISLAAVRDVLADSSIKVGAQNLYYREKGAFTGEISPLMLARLCEYVIVGHSERRMYFGEDDDTVNRKVKAAAAVGLKPILCVGERLEENEKGLTAETVSRQVLAALSGVSPLTELVVAYEPVWAIGTGKSATGKQAQETVSLVRGKLGEALGADAAQRTRILYGGSVTAANIAEFVGQPDIDGALVGGASLKAQEFVSIVQQTAAIKNRR